MKNLNRLFLLLLLAPALFSFYSCGEATIYGDWIRVSDFSGVARSDAASFVIGNKGYVFGGYDGEDRLSDLWEFDSEADSWTQLAEFPGIPRNSATGFAIGTKGYVGLGFDGNDYMNDFWEYDTQTDAWTQKDNFKGSARTGAIGFGLKGKGYMGLGFDDNFLKDMYQFDPAAAVDNQWVKIADIGGSKRNNATVFTYKDEAFVVGGVNNGLYVADFWKFDPVNQKWIEMNAIKDQTDNSWDDHYKGIVRQYGLAFVIGQKAYLTGGTGESGLINTNWEYVFADDKWDEASAFEGTSRTAGLAFSLGTRGFILTGRSSNYRFDDVWEFLPDQEYNPDRY